VNTELITITFSSETRAAELLPLLVDVDGPWHVNILGIVAMTRGADGRIHILDEEAHQPMHAVLRTLRFPNDYLSVLANDLVPNASGIAMLVEQSHADALLDVLSRFTGQIHRYNSAIAYDMQPI
jgi:uncharacterized membrane protein